MFDTVRLAVETVAPGPGELLRLGWQEHTSREWDKELGEAKERVTFRRFSDVEPHYMQFNGADFDGAYTGTLKIESSLPKVNGGTNVRLLGVDEVGSVLDELSNRSIDAFGADLPHAGEWATLRADAVINWDTRGNDGASRVPDYLLALGPREIPRHTKKVIDRGSTHYWFNKSRMVYAYDKAAESGEESAAGLLRFEARILRVKSELRSLGLHGKDDKSPAVARTVLNWSTARQILDRYRVRLGGDFVVTDELALIDRLLDEVKPHQVKNMIGVLHLFRTYGFDELERRGFARRSLFRWRAQLIEYGVPVSEVGGGPLVLPPLELPHVGEYDGEPVRVRLVA